ncbi:MAG: FAD-dependent oxidoreductase [Candidatus Sungbacteria bacterium]|nr:FAD-dependent oxidoreductase [Candidatus Sungbacteria bacterium]
MKNAAFTLINSAKGAIGMRSDGDAYDLVIIGGGVVGTAVYFRAALSFEIRSAALLEKHHAVAQVNSNVLANAETAHRGDKETNFSLPKALRMHAFYKYLVAYLKERGHGAYVELPAMVISTNVEEANLLRMRFKMLKPHYPDLELIGWQEIAAIEPKVVEGRNEDEKKHLYALYSKGHAVDYAQLAESFVREGDKEAKANGKEFHAFFRTKVFGIERDADNTYLVKTNRGVFRAKTLVISAGPYSLMFAKRLGVRHAENGLPAEEYAILPVAGSFHYTTEKFLNGKVYTVQDENIPFAAPHADRAVYNENETRIGPTAIVLPFFERHHFSTIVDFMKMGMLRPWDYFLTLLRVLGDPRLSRFELKNILYNFPILGKWFFLKWGAQKVIPTMRFRDLHFGRGMGGIRPQLLNLKTRKLEMGLGKFVGDSDNPVICNVTPSPGASSCMGNAIEDIELVESFLKERGVRNGS